MADQVNPTGGLAPGISTALVARSAPKPAPEKPRPVRTAEPAPQGAGRAAGPTTKPSEATVEQANSQLQQVATGLKFQVDEATGHTVVKVVNQETGEVLLQMPPEEFLSMARNLRALQERLEAAGALIDKEG